MFTVAMWADGSCNNPTRQGGWCAIVSARNDGVTETDIAELVHIAHLSLSDTRTDIEDFDGDNKLRAKVSILRGREENTTDQRMELIAILKGLEAFTKPCHVRIVTDSAYAIGCLGGSYKVEANLDLINEWKVRTRGFIVDLIHVSSNNPLIEWCNRLAHGS